MVSVGVRELKARLSHYLDTVLRGEDVVVTKWGRPLVRMVRESGERNDLHRDLAALAAELL